MIRNEERLRRRLTRVTPQWAIIAVLTFGGLLTSFMFTLVVPIQSKLPELLGESRENTAWVVTSTLLAAAVSTPIAGRLGDMYGKRRIVLVLLATMVVGSAVAALSPGIIGIIVGRTLQGAVVGIVPLGISILRDVLHENRVDSSVALMSATLGVGGALGLPLSAMITERADWHLLFWIAGALGAATFVAVLLVVPPAVLRTAGRFDFVGAIGLGIALVALLLAISRGSEWGWASPPTLALGAGGVAVLLLWAWHQLRVKQPLLDLRVASRRPVLLTNITALIMGFALFASNVLFPQLLELPVESGSGFGLSLLAASLVVMPSGIVMMLISPLSGRLARRVGPKMLLIIGAIGMALAYGYTLLFATEVWHLVVSNLLVGLGIGFGYAGMPMLIMRSVPQSETGASNGLNSLFRSLGTSIAAAVIGGILASNSVPFEGTRVPAPEGFTLSFALGLGAAVLALVIVLFIPGQPSPKERHPSLPG